MVSAGKVTGIVVGGLISALMLGALGPTVFTNLSTFANDTSLSTSESAVAGTLGIFVILGILFAVLKGSGVKMN